MALAEKLNQFTAFMMQQQKQTEELRQRKLMASLTEAMQKEIGGAKNLTELSNLTAKHIQTALKMGAPDLVRYAGAFSDIRKEAMLDEKQKEGTKAYMDFVRRDYGSLVTGMKDGKPTYMKDLSEWADAERLPEEVQAKAFEHIINTYAPKESYKQVFRGGKYYTRKYVTSGNNTTLLGEYDTTGDNLLTPTKETDVQPGQKEAESDFAEKKFWIDYQHRLQEASYQRHNPNPYRFAGGVQEWTTQDKKTHKGMYDTLQGRMIEFTGLPTGAYWSKGGGGAMKDLNTLYDNVSGYARQLKTTRGKIDSDEARRGLVYSIADYKYKYFNSLGIKNSLGKPDFEYDQMGRIDFKNEKNLAAWDALSRKYSQSALKDFIDYHEAPLYETQAQGLLEEMTRQTTGGLNGDYDPLGGYGQKGMNYVNSTL